MRSQGRERLHLRLMAEWLRFASRAPASWARAKQHLKSLIFTQKGAALPLSLLAITNFCFSAPAIAVHTWIGYTSATINDFGDLTVSPDNPRVMTCDDETALTSLYTCPSSGVNTNFHRLGVSSTINNQCATWFGSF